MISDTTVSQPNHPSYRHAALQPGSGPTFADPPAAKPDGSSFRSVQSHPDSRVPMSEHAAAYLNQWNAGRAASSTNTSDTAVNCPAPMPEKPHSAVPAIGVEGGSAGGEQRAEVAEASATASSTPLSVLGEADGVDTVMDSPEAESPEDDKFRNNALRRTEDTSGTIFSNREVGNHPGKELKDEVEIKQEHEASSDWKKNIREEHAKQIRTGDDDSDVELISWKKIKNKTTAEHRRGEGTKTKEAKLDRVIKRGVAHVKKPEPKRKGKTMPKHVG